MEVYLILKLFEIFTTFWNSVLEFQFNLLGFQIFLISKPYSSTWRIELNLQAKAKNNRDLRRGDCSSWFIQINIVQIYLIFSYKTRAKITINPTEPIMSSSKRLFEELTKSPFGDCKLNDLSILRNEFKSSWKKKLSKTYQKKWFYHAHVLA